MNTFFNSVPYECSCSHITMNSCRQCNFFFFRFKKFFNLFKSLLIYALTAVFRCCYSAKIINVHFNHAIRMAPTKTIEAKLGLCHCLYILRNAFADSSSIATGAKIYIFYNFFRSNLHFFSKNNIFQKFFLFYSVNHVFFYPQILPPEAAAPAPRLSQLTHKQIE